MAAVLLWELELLVSEVQVAMVADFEGFAESIDEDVDGMPEGDEEEETDPEIDVTVTFIKCPKSFLTVLSQQSVPFLAHQNPRPWRGQGIA